MYKRDNFKSYSKVLFKKKKNLNGEADGYRMENNFNMKHYTGIRLCFSKLHIWDKLERTILSVIPRLFESSDFSLCITFPCLKNIGCHIKTLVWLNHIKHGFWFDVFIEIIRDASRSLQNQGWDLLHLLQALKAESVGLVELPIIILKTWSAIGYNF